MTYTPNQIKGIKKIQSLSFKDKEFRKKTGFKDMTFEAVINSGRWSLDALEELGRGLKIIKYGGSSTAFEDCKPHKPKRTKAVKQSLGEHIRNKARSFNKRDRKHTKG